MRSFILLLALGLGASVVAQAAPELKVLDLSKNFQDTRLNLATDQTYANGAVVVVPAPSTQDDQYLVSIQESWDAQCAVSGMMSRKNADNTTSYYFIIHVLNVPMNGGHCFVGAFMRNHTAVKQAYIDLFAERQ